MTRPRTAARRRGRVVRRWAVGFAGRRAWGVAKPAILQLISPLAMLVVAATVLCCVLGFVLARQADDYLENRPSPGAARRDRGAAGGVARSRRRRSEADPYPGARLRPQGSAARRGAAGGRTRGAVADRFQRPHRRLVQLGVGAARDRDDHAAAAVRRPDRARAVRLCDAGDVATAPARLSARPEHPRGAAARLRGSGHRPAEPAPAARVHRASAGHAPAGRDWWRSR